MFGATLRSPRRSSLRNARMPSSIRFFMTPLFRDTRPSWRRRRFTAPAASASCGGVRMKWAADILKCRVRNRSKNLRIEDELRSQYSIGYVSDATDNSGAFRKIRLTAGSKLAMRTRWILSQVILFLQTRHAAERGSKAHGSQNRFGDRFGRRHAESVDSRPHGS